MTAPIQPEFHEVMNAIASAVDKALNGDERPKTIGFCLHVFKFGDIKDGRVNYISNADRADMIAVTKEWLARAEGRYAETTSKQ